MTGVNFFRERTNEIHKVAAEHNYDVLISMNSEHSLPQIQRIVKNRKADGVIATRSKIGFSVISLLQDNGIPFLITGSTSNPEVLHVDNNRDAARDLVAVLISRGIRKMALLNRQENYCVTHSFGVLHIQEKYRAGYFSHTVYELERDRVWRLPNRWNIPASISRFRRVKRRSFGF